MLRKLFFFLAPLFAIILLLPRSVSADGEFRSDVNVDYKIAPTGLTTVINTITLTNAVTDLYATSYTLSLENLNPKNIQAFDLNNSLPFSENKVGGRDDITVNFPDAVVGKGNSRTFTLSFDENSFAVKTGEIWEIQIPRIASNQTYNSYNVNIFVPTSFGKEAYISPNPEKTSQQRTFLVYTYVQKDLAKSGVTAGFGNFQVFSFVLNYHLENPLAINSSTQIAIPPDTAYQKMYYSSLTPTPFNISVDPDGNWIATYELQPRQKLDIKASGSVQIFASFRPFTKTSDNELTVNLKPTEYWRADDPQIVSLARSLQTPKAIYDYVTSTLSYDYQRVQPNVERLGAVKALQNPKNAICMEFTDLFIALARAAGIPAQEINGYAYTENPQIEPLSLVADVLHSWPEYWDKTRQVWVPVDPTWGTTTNGVDFFSKLDLRHFTFVIHGASSTIPYPAGSYKLGTNPTKDVFVNFGDLPKQRVSTPQISYVSSPPLPFTGSKIAVKIYNPGPVALYNLSPEILFDSKSAPSTSINALPPYASYTMILNIPFSFLANKTPDKVEIILADQKIEIPSFKQQVIVYNLLAIFILFALIVLIIVLRIKRISLFKIYSRVFTKNAGQNQTSPEVTQPQGKS